MIELEDIEGEPFNVEREGNYVCLTHDKWSLSGRGRSLSEAEDDLYREVEKIKDAYADAPPSELTSSTLRLKKFIRKLEGAGDG